MIINLISLFLFSLAPQIILGLKFNSNTRDDLGYFLQSQGAKFKTGVEVGVHRGIYAKSILDKWSNCKNFYLVDIWKQLTNYKDGGNFPDDEQEKIYKEALNNVSNHKEKIKVFRDFSSNAAKYFVKNRMKFDFIYIDARHDYCGAKEDILSFYPVLNSGGIIAGHDYGYKWPSNENWNICADGSYNPGSVKRAVDEFAKNNSLNLMLIETTWILQKP